MIVIQKVIANKRAKWLRMRVAWLHLPLRVAWQLDFHLKNETLVRFFFSKIFEDFYPILRER